MNKIILFIFIHYFSINLFAQDYTPMLTLGKVWNMHHYDTFIPDNNYDFEIALDYTLTINGFEYFHTTNGDLLREDITNKKVYRLVDTVEELLLDFDLEVGDELISPLIYLPENTNPITEISTNSFYGISDLKYYSLDCGEKIIEGIGVQTVGLFGLSTGCEIVDFNEGNSLINMSTLSIDNYFAENNIKLFYNKDNNSLQLNNNANNLIDLQIYSILGKKVLSNKTKFLINVSHLDKGIYFYTMSKNHDVKKGKILIY